MKKLTFPVFIPACHFLLVLAKFRLGFIIFTLTLAFQLITSESFAQYTKLLDFTGTNGLMPHGSLVSDGTFLYGMTLEGGTNGMGVIFKIRTDGTGYVKLLDFAGVANGRRPHGSLIFDGTFLYGMTRHGGLNDAGVVFKIMPDGTGFLKLLDFEVPANGGVPIGSLITDGTFLYGMTQAGGTSSLGIIFKIRTDGTGYAKLLDFNGTNGRRPQGSLTSDGTFLYGMTLEGGTNGVGVIFKIKTDGTGFVTLLDFNNTNGQEPQGSLISDGTFLYGMTSHGGAANLGVVFKIKTDGSGYAMLHDFAGLSDGMLPFGDLLFDGAFLYGMTTGGGTSSNGVIFKIMPDGTGYSKLFDCNVTDGRHPYGSLISNGGFLYGMTSDGGTNNGTIFKYSIAATLPTITSFTPTSGPIGTTVTITGTNFSTTPTGNTVMFNGTTAVVTASTTTSITTTVPVGATTGKITVTVAGNTATSATDFTVTAISAITINPQPSSTVVCDGATAIFTLTASGTTNLAYQWQFSTSLAGTFNDIGNVGGYSNVATATLSVNTTGNFGAGFYRCKVSGDLAATVFTNAAELTVNAIPSAPSVTGSSTCNPGTVLLTASGGVNGQYRWYTASTGGTIIMGEINSTYTTPSLSSTTTYYVSVDNGSCESTRAPAVATVLTLPAGPSAITSSICGSGSVILSASGAVNGQYRWYAVATGGTAIVGQVNNSFTTPTLSTTTTYYVSINNGTCESTRTSVIAQINTVPSAPTVTGATGCPLSSVTLTAAGGSNGQYRWYTASTGATIIMGEINSTYTTPPITVATLYYVAISNGICESLRTPVTATVTGPCNQPPVISTTSLQAKIEGTVTLKITDLLSDPDNNLDLSTLKIVQPPKSGASASIDPDFNLILSYLGISFAGTDELTLEVCDLGNACAQQKISIEVIGGIIVYNAVSPNGDDKNPAFILKYIEVLSETKKNNVSIYNRWGDEVFSMADYDNKTRVFVGLTNNGTQLPSGTYFYKIVLPNAGKTLTGFLDLKY